MWASEAVVKSVSLRAVCERTEWFWGLGSWPSEEVSVLVSHCRHGARWLTADVPCMLQVLLLWEGITCLFDEWKISLTVNTKYEPVWQRGACIYIYKVFFVNPITWALFVSISWRTLGNINMEAKSLQRLFTFAERDYWKKQHDRKHCWVMFAVHVQKCAKTMKQD